MPTHPLTTSRSPQYVHFFFSIREDCYISVFSKCGTEAGGDYSIWQDQFLGVTGSAHVLRVEVLSLFVVLLLYVSSKGDK